MMLDKNKIYCVFIGLFLALTPNVVLAQNNREVEMTVLEKEQTSQFQKIEQPFGLKLAVALGGLGLIGAELWWFMVWNEYASRDDNS